MSSPSHSRLSQVPVDEIEKNPENPRMIFNQGRLDSLAESISKEGILVPLIVYEDGPGKYILLDGERRWQCARKLNLKTVPANIVAKPTPLENILTMFNIHNVREEWELMPTAIKLGQLLHMKGVKGANERRLAELTSLDVGTIRRCKILLSLPKMYQDAILDHQLKSDFFIEMDTKVLRKIETALPDLYDEYGRDALIDLFVNMQKSGKIKNVTDFRLFQKVLQAERLGLEKKKVEDLARSVIVDQTMDFRGSYEQIEDLVNISKVEEKIAKLTETIKTLGLNSNVLAKRRSEERDSLRSTLTELRDCIDQILGLL